MESAKPGLGKEIVGLISGGKDSIFNLMKCKELGYNIVALGNLHYAVKGKEEDSYMYQSVGSEIIEMVGECLNVPLYRREIKGKPVNLEMEYKGGAEENKGDEVEDLYLLLKEIKEKHPNLAAVSSGAIWSTYQKNRVENVCERLGLESVALLWEREQKALLLEMIENGMEAITIKTAVVGLDPTKHLGKTIKELQPYLFQLAEKYKINVCGEGGEFESLTLDCPIYKKKIVM